jgi:hypothetical protein
MGAHQVVMQPPRHWPQVGLKVKKDEIDIVIKRKSHLITKGYVQQADINFD